MLRSLPLLILFIAPPLLADDYPQWLGPQRDGIYREAGVIASIPTTGLTAKWRAPVGAGYSGAAVAGGKVFVTDRVLAPGANAPSANWNRRQALPGSERIHCLDAASGKSLWTVEYDCPYTVSYPAGPRCTPAVDLAAGKVYTLGTEGDVHCVNIADGKVAWHRKLEGPTPIWGFAGHPLIEGDKLIVLGSGKDALVIALDKRTGVPLWTALKAKEPGYSPPMIRTLSGRRQLVIWHPGGLAGIGIETGKPLWQVDHGPIRFGASVVSPAQVDPDVLVVSSEFEGSAAFRVDPNANSAARLWAVPRKGRATNTLCTLMSPLVVTDGLVVGINIDGVLRAIDGADGHVAWETTAATTGEDGPKQWYAAFITPHQLEGQRQPNRFFIATEAGELLMARMSARGYEPVGGRTRLLDPTNTDARRPALWCHPAYANRSLYWRNDKELVCFDLSE